MPSINALRPATCLRQESTEVFERDVGKPLSIHLSCNNGERFGDFAILLILKDVLESIVVLQHRFK